MAVATAVMATVVRRVKEGEWPSIYGFAAGVCALVMVWSAVSIIWSIDPPAAHVSKLVRLTEFLDHIPVGLGRSGARNQQGGR